MTSEARKVTNTINQPVYDTTENSYLHLKSYVALCAVEILAQFHITLGERNYYYSIQQKKKVKPRNSI